MQNHTGPTTRIPVLQRETAAWSAAVAACHNTAERFCRQISRSTITRPNALREDFASHPLSAAADSITMINASPFRAP